MTAAAVRLSVRNNFTGCTFPVAFYGPDAVARAIAYASLKCDQRDAKGDERFTIRTVEEPAHEGFVGPVENAVFCYSDEARDAQRAEIAAEARNERYFEERGGSSYVGSEEEARDRFLDSLRDA